MVLLCESLLLDHLPKLVGKELPIYKAIINSTCSIPHHIRKLALNSIKQIISAPKSTGTVHACALLTELSNYMLSAKIVNREQRESSEPSKNHEVHPHIFVEVRASLIKKLHLKYFESY